LCIEETISSDKVHKLVMKYSLGELSSDKDRNSDDKVQNEFGWLQILRGAEHIVKLVNLANCPLKILGISNGEDASRESSPNALPQDQTQGNYRAATAAGAPDTTDPSRARKFPTFALEYLPNDTLATFVQRPGNKGQWVPNRFLWRIWLCCKPVLSLSPFHGFHVSG
jgi:hypothetical protein